jgi:hypothetical protein
MDYINTASSQEQRYHYDKDKPNVKLYCHGNLGVLWG